MKKRFLSIFILLLCTLSITVSASIPRYWEYCVSFEQYETRVAKGDLPELFIPYEKISFMGDFKQVRLPIRPEYTSVIYHFRNREGEIFSFAVLSSLSEVNPVPITDTTIPVEDLRFIDVSKWGQEEVCLRRLGMQDVQFKYQDGALKSIILEYNGLFYVFSEDTPYKLSMLNCTCTDDNDSFICRLLNSETSVAAIEEVKLALSDFYGNNQQTTTPAPVPQNEPNPLRYLIIPVAIVAVGGTAGLVWYRVRKKKD